MCKEPNRSDSLTWARGGLFYQFRARTGLCSLWLIAASPGGGNLLASPPLLSEFSCCIACFPEYDCQHSDVALGPSLVTFYCSSCCLHKPLLLGKQGWAHEAVKSWSESICKWGGRDRQINYAEGSYGTVQPCLMITHAGNMLSLIRVLNT